MKYQLRKQHDGTWRLTSDRSTVPVCVGSFAICRMYLWGYGHRPGNLSADK